MTPKLKLYPSQHFEPKSPSVTGNVCYHYNTCVTGVYMAYMFDKILEEEHLKLSDYLNQI